MLAICDSGASKGDWAFLLKNETIFAESSGFNPYTHDHHRYQQELLTNFDQTLRLQIKEVHFYGSGCAEAGQKHAVSDLLQQVFIHATRIEVHTDLLAAARATCGTEKGIACILGTGSNSGLYDGIDFIDAVPNLGYLLGDEGSGNYVGKLLIRAYSFREMPDDIIQLFDEFYPGKHEAIVKRLYSKEQAVNTFLATFMRFAHQHKDHPFIKKILYKNFQNLVDSNLSKYDNFTSTPIHFVGSVAFHFQDQLKECLTVNHMHCGKILAKPLHELIEYHRLLSS